MAAEAELNVSLNPRLSGVDDLIGQLRRTGAALEGLADSLQALSDGGPDMMRSIPDAERSVPDSEPSAECPFRTTRTVHDRHVISVPTFEPGTLDVKYESMTCPGWPDTPPDNDSDSPAYVRTDYAKCPAAQLGTGHDPHDFAVVVGHPDNPTEEPLRTVWRCAGHPARPWGPGH